jgi:para-aminobenzoate synthetase/4-amino-4-deoxychorismate lyase
MSHCFALLDDTSPDAGPARSRLYTGHAGTLKCHDAGSWPAVLEQLALALSGGQHAVAVCSYELGAGLHGVTAQPAPLAQILLFNECRHLDRAEVDAWLNRAIDAAGDVAAAGIAGLQASVDEAEFAAALARIHDYITAGDTYQINYTYRLRFDAYGSPCALYARLRERQPVPYGALIALPDGGAVLSLSPELFIRHEDGVATARPMKGTAPAAPPEQAEENAARARALAADPKNRAENLMIVDLLRNDLGRIAQTGSVEVPALFEVSRYGDVLQMTSTVSAALLPQARLADIFQALYPCGSITGAPKQRSMEIIAELESAPRGVYTGAIGWFDPPARPGAVGDFCLSVPIRTLALQAPAKGVRRGEMGVGAGIVFDSDAASEWAECQLKARFLTGLPTHFELFETMHANGAAGIRHLARHLRRLAASAAYFGFPCDVAKLASALEQACANFRDDTPRRLRLALRHAGSHAITDAILAPLSEPVRLLLGAAQQATQADDLFLRHKTTLRAHYDAGWRAAEAQGAFDTLFFNERDELTEGGRSNVFVRIGEHWHTPPLACGLLPGIMREVLLQDPAWNASERVITRAMLLGADDIVVCNALRGPLRAVVSD